MTETETERRHHLRKKETETKLKPQPHRIYPKETENNKTLKQTPSKSQKRKCDAEVDRDRNSKTDPKKRKQETVSEILARFEQKQMVTGEKAAVSDNNKPNSSKTFTSFSKKEQGAQVEEGADVPGHLACKAELCKPIMKLKYSIF